MDEPDQIGRICAMEQKLNRALDAISAMETALETYRDAQSDIAALDAYLTSETWRQDFEADALGRLPADLPRGVLSEDGIYNMLESDGALRKALRELCGADSGAEEP